MPCSTSSQAPRLPGVRAVRMGRPRGVLWATPEPYLLGDERGGEPATSDDGDNERSSV